MPQPRKAKKDDEDDGKIRINVAPDTYLRQHGHDVQKVWRVWSAGDSDFKYETFLFSTPAGLVKTAVIVRGETLVVRDGWDQFYVECY